MGMTFRKRYTHWPVYIALRDISVVLLMCVSPGEGTAQLIMGTIVFLTYAFATSTEQPYADRSNNFIEAVTNFCIGLQLLCTGVGGFQRPAVKGMESEYKTMEF